MMIKQLLAAAVLLLATACERKNSYSAAEIVSPALLAEIDNFIYHQSSAMMVAVGIAESAACDKCLLFISPGDYYDAASSSGYFMYNQRLVSFTIDCPPCNKHLVDTTKLSRDQPEGWGLNDESLPAFPEDYRLRKYNIHSSDSLEMVFWGYW